MFRSPVAVAVWYIWLVVAVANLADLAWQGGGHAAWVAAAIIVLVTGVAYVTALRPQVIADDDGLTVRNPLRDTRVPWGAVSGIDLGDSLRVRLGTDRVLHCWAIQSSRRNRIRAQYTAQFRQAQAARRTPGYARMPEEARSTVTKSAGEVFAGQIDTRFEEARRRREAELPSGTAGTVSGTWSWTAVGALAFPAVLVVLAFLIR